MQFYDEVSIKIESGRGGDGCVSGRREMGAAFGGPNGGNGGDGGAIIIQSDKTINTLLEYKYHRNFKAHKGESGRTKDQYGANGEDVILKVPLGTIIRDKKTDMNIFYFSQDGQKFVALEGGLGGRGNIEFKTAVMQYPDFAEYGEPGHTKELILELQLMGDVALVGSPSVGKSTIINAISNTKAKVADYHFTTLIPHLGAVKIDDFTFNIIDIPGLIKGASSGKGLGNEFLRHILKANIFTFVTDAYRFDNGIFELIDILDELIIYLQNKIHKIDNTYIDLNIYFIGENNKIFLYVKQGEEVILKKQIIFVINKIDLVQDQDLLSEISNQLFDKLVKYKFETIQKTLFKKLDKNIFNKNIFYISGATHNGLEGFKKYLALSLETESYIQIDYQTQVDIHIDQITQKDLITDITEQEKAILIQKGYINESENPYTKVWEIYNKEICKLAFMTQWGKDQGELHFWKTLQSMGYLDTFQHNGMVKGDVLKIISFYEEYEHRYIMW